MARKLRIKFILMTMIILFFVFATMGGVSFALLKSNFKRGTNQKLNSLLYDLDYNDTIQNQLIIKSVVVKESISGQIFYFYDKNQFSEENVLSLFDLAKNKEKESGKIGAVYYLLEENNFLEKYTFVATDRSVEIQIFNYNIIRIILILIITYLLLGIIVVLLSYKVTEPLNQTLIKQKQFISDASHELKTPLSIISANADVLRNENGSNEWLDNIKEQINRMSSLINDMLSLAKMEETKDITVPVNFNLSSAITNCLLSFDAVAFEKNKKLSSFILPNISYKGNEESVKKIVNILVDNAFKYSNNEGDIICSLEMISNKPVIKVYNTTDKISPSIKNKLFERFYRADLSRNRSTGGSGLGLSIAKKICDTNKWKISVNIEEDRSLTISIIL